MNRLLSLLAVVGLFSCEPDERLTGVAAGAAGRYVVTAYIVAGDTLFALLPGSTAYKPGINKAGVDNFTVELATIGAEKLLMRTTYWSNGLRTTVSKEVTVRLNNYNYQFSLVPTNPASDYDGSVGRFTGLFYERTADKGLLIPPAGSPVHSGSLPSNDVIIVAQPVK